MRTQLSKREVMLATVVGVAVFLVLNLVVITTGTTAYRRKDGIAVVPASLLGP